jgi:hypothetical protein
MSSSVTDLTKGGETAAPRAFHSLIVLAALCFTLLLIDTVSAQVLSGSPNALDDAMNIRSDLGYSIWVHSPEEAIFGVGGARDTLFQFAEKPTGSRSARSPIGRSSITRFLLTARFGITSGKEEADSLGSLIREAHRRNIRVDFIDGDPSWINTNWGDGISIVRDFLRYQRESAAEDRFDGIILHVEPYLLRSWGSDLTWKQYVRFVEQAGLLIRGSGLPTSFCATMPYWYLSTPGRTATTDLVKLLDAVVLLDRIGRVNGIADGVRDGIALADSLRTKVTVCLEARNDVMPHMSLYSQGWSSLDSAISVVHHAYVLHPEFDGILVDSYESMRSIRRSLRSLPGFPADSVLPVIREISSQWRIIPVPPSVFRGTKKVRVCGITGEKVPRIVNIGEIPISALCELRRAGRARIQSLLASNPLEVVRRSPVEMRALVDRLCASPFDGIVINLYPLQGQLKYASSTNVTEGIIRAISMFAAFFHQPDLHPDAPIIVRCDDAFLRSITQDLMGEFTACTDAIIYGKPLP